MALNLPLKKILTEPSIPRSYSVIVYKDKNNTYAKNENGDIICQNSPTSCIQEAVNYLQSYGGGRILVKRGIYYPTQPIIIPDGAKIIIEGEGSLTVFRYTQQFILFRHMPENPTWTSEIVLRNFKIDRSGSGDKNTDVVEIDYAKFVMYDGIELIDDWRPMHGDAGLTGYNNIVAIAKNNKVYNKSYGIWLFGHLSVMRENHVENTAMVGIAGAGLLQVMELPPGYAPGGITVIENNACVDCGKTDEAIAIDYGDPNPAVDGLGIIRNNRIINTNSVAEHAIAVVKTKKAIVENNEIAGNITRRTIAYSIPGNIIIRNNFINVNIIKTYDDPGLLFSGHGNIVFENNRITVDIGRDAPQTVENIFYVYDGRILMKNNRITFNIYQNTSVRNQLVYIDREAIIEDNDIVLNYGSSSYKAFHIYGSIIMSKNKIRVNAAEGSYLSFPVGVDLYYENPHAIITNNVISGSIEYVLAIGPTVNSDEKRIIIKDNIFGSSLANSKALLFVMHQYSPTVHFVYKGNMAVPPMANAATLYFGSSAVPTFIVDWDVPLIDNWGTAVYKLARRNSGKAVFSGDGVTRQFRIPHNLVSTPSKVLVTPASENAVGQFYVTADDEYIYVNYTTPPPTGTNNIILNWYAEI